MGSDEKLMLDFQLGSRAAFEELFGRYRGSLYAFFRRRVPSKERAEDLTQETFLAVVQASARYEPRARVRTYLYAIAMNLLAAERRREAKQHSVSALVQEPAGADAREQSLWIAEALEKLKAVERDIVMLREYEQLSYGEIAELLRIPENTVRSRLFRARMALREYFKPRMADKRRDIAADR